MIGLSWLLSNPGKNGNDQKGLSLACSSLGYRNRRSVQSFPSEATKSSVCEGLSNRDSKQFILDALQMFLIMLLPMLMCKQGRSQGGWGWFSPPDISRKTMPKRLHIFLFCFATTILNFFGMCKTSLERCF